MRNTIGKITSHIAFKMFQSATLESLDAVDQESVDDSLRRVFLLWPFNLIHFVPDWLLILGVTIVILLLLKFFLDPIIALCHLLKDSSFGVTEKLLIHVCEQ